MSLTSTQIAEEQKDILGNETPLNQQEIEDIVNYHWEKAQNKIAALYDYERQSRNIAYVGKTLFWFKVNEPDSMASWQSKTSNGVIYNIYSSANRTDCPTDLFVLARFYEIDDYKEVGYIGEYQGEVGICCGFALACAIGIPSQCIRKTTQELFDMAEKDLENIKNGKEIVLINKLLRHPLNA